MINFLIGLFIGAFIGIGIMCLLQVAKDGEV
ncbi:MAG TPA: DUF3789 domain-containing protein [Clostridiaceae bacterium]|mgnify:FL=1|nr:DUF3789 domain-containing protein [Clostridiaceae bacterium]